MHVPLQNKLVTRPQFKLTIGQPGDKYEQEADAMADQVMRMPQSDVPIQRQCEDCEEESLQMKPLVASITPVVQMEPMEEEEDIVQAKSEGGTMNSSAGLSSQLSQSKGGGSGLSDATNQHMSNAFGTDFSGVRIHTDSNAVHMNRSLGARAFTQGSDVYFNEGEYSPESGKGKHLLAHELTHVVQQDGRNHKAIQRKVKDSNVVTSKAMLKELGLTRVQIIKTITDADTAAIGLAQGAENALNSQLANAINGSAIDAKIETILKEELGLSFANKSHHKLIRQQSGRFKKVRKTLESGYLRYMSLGIGKINLTGCAEGDCTGSYAFTCAGNRLMVLCKPFWNEPIEQPGTILHEPFHIWFHMARHASNAIRRADSSCFEAFARRIAGKTAPSTCVGHTNG